MIVVDGIGFELLMIFYLIESIMLVIICEVKVVGVVVVKLYLVGVIINLVLGVKDICNIYLVLEVMFDCGMFLLVYGEVIDGDIDIFDWEKVFFD